MAWLGPSCDAARSISAQSNRTVPVARSYCAAGFTRAAASRTGCGAATLSSEPPPLDGVLLPSAALTG